MIGQPFYYFAEASTREPFRAFVIRSTIHLDADADFLVTGLKLQWSDGLAGTALLDFSLPEFQPGDIHLVSGEVPIFTMLQLKAGSSVVIGWKFAKRPWWKCWLWLSRRYAVILLCGSKSYPSPAIPGRDETPKRDANTFP